ncbi:hypothetical protein J4219_02905 [Candidatus Woesearchaeota archaeon]|nr:hypothetical protein [Candidatus Woesearchaeota archaeon]
MIVCVVWNQWEVVGSGNARYGEALVALRGLCAGDDGLHPFVQGLARPLTFKETIQARINQFEREGAASLWERWLDTSSAIVYQKDTTKFRLVVPCSDALLNDVPESFRNFFLPVNYDDFTSFVELDVQDRVDLYNRPLTPDQVLKHKGWLAVVEGDKKLLKRYSDIVFGQIQGGVAMAFWTVPRQDAQGRWVCPAQSQLRPLCANNVRYDCGCIGYRILYNSARFARVRPL